MSIVPVYGPVAPAPDITTPSNRETSVGFGDSLTRLIGAVETSGQEANTAVSRMLDGSGDVHDAMIALQRAELTFQLTMQVRNKLVQAYQEIMRMPV